MSLADFFLPTLLQKPIQAVNTRILYHQPMELYHALPYIHSSLLRHLDPLEAPVTAWHHSFLNPDRPADQNTQGKHLGSVFHCLILEPDQFALRYRFKNCKNTTLPGLIGDAQSGQWDRLQIMQRELLAHPQFQRLQQEEDYRTEVSIFTEWHTQSGMRLPVCSRPDILTKRRQVNLKCLREVTPWAVAKAINHWRYDQGSAFYSEVAAKAGFGHLDESFFFVETNAPWRIMYIERFSASVLEEAHTRNVAAIEKFADLFEEHGECRWPGYPTLTVHQIGEGGANALTLPPRHQF